MVDVPCPSAPSLPESAPESAPPPAPEATPTPDGATSDSRADPAPAADGIATTATAKNYVSSKCATCGVEESTDTSTEERQDEGKVVVAAHFVTRWQLWDKDNSKWDPYDPDKTPKEVVVDYPDSYFMVNIRHKKPYDQPKLVLSTFSAPLLAFLRAVIGNEFFNDNPEYPVVQLFIKMKDIRQKKNRAQELLTSKGYLDTASEAKEVEELGFLDATKPTASWAMGKTYLAELLAHLEPFLAYMNEQFAPIEAKLARMREYGQIEFDMLLYHFEPGMKLVGFDCPSGRPDAMVLLSREIDTSRGDNGPLVLNGYAYHFDGDEFKMRDVRRKIHRYTGTRRMDSLAAMELPAEVEQILKRRGELYTTLAGVQHKEYEGNRVILDPKAYANRNGYTRDSQAVIKSLADDLLYLLPPDIEGFNLANKVCQECQRLGYECPPEDCQTWQMFDVTKVKDVVFDENAWDHLVLDPDTKLLIEALVRVTDNANTSGAIISDVISGKGGGLISVLHGPPGTGKTLTAESIAEHLHRPIYMVGFSELSTFPDNLELNLRRILKLATAWDAVLLIDEADVFLEQRSLHELERNALVSVALRLLEYHRGVLFLTTNRITTFDEAFLSRFSIAIKYHELDRAGRYAVWRKFFELAGCRIEGSDDSDEFTAVDTSAANISADELDELAEKLFNGRTIKNLVRTAQALALSQKKSLSVEHVKTVVRVQEMFLREFASTNTK